MALIFLVALAPVASAQTSLPWCPVNPTAADIGPAKPECPQLAARGEWAEFGVNYDNGVDDAIVVTPGPSVPVEATWGGNVATAAPAWVEAGVVAAQRITLNSVLISTLHRSCARNQSLPGSYCISLGQAYRALQIAAERGATVVPVPSFSGPVTSPTFLSPGYVFPGGFVKPESLVRPALEQLPVRWAEVGLPGPHQVDTQCRSKVCDYHVLTPSQIGRILTELKAGPAPTEVRVDVQNGTSCKYVPLCEF